MPEWLRASNEVRLDADVRCNPDVVADMRDLGNIGGFDTVFCSHALEHLSAPDGDIALSEFWRVLKEGGTAIVMVPDLQDIQPTHDALYVSSIGPISGHDMIYGHIVASEQNEFMRHKSGYVADSLQAKMEKAGFRKVIVKRIQHYNLLAVGIK